MQYSQEHLKTMVYAEFGGANIVYYGEFENREWGTLVFFFVSKVPNFLHKENPSVLSCYHPLVVNITFCHERYYMIYCGRPEEPTILISRQLLRIPST